MSSQFKQMHQLLDTIQKHKDRMDPLIHRTLRNIENRSPLEKEEEKQWIPNNSEIKVTAIEDLPLSDEEWNKMEFPFHNMPDKVQTHVNTKQWEAFTKERSGKPGEALMKIVLGNLKKGCDSGVVFPGNLPTFSKNSFEDPAIDIPRIADALATEIKADYGGTFPFRLCEGGKGEWFFISG